MNDNDISHPVVSLSQEVYSGFLLLARSNLRFAQNRYYVFLFLSMVKFFKHKFTYEHSWSEVTRAHWLKYQNANPFASHVLTSDVLDRFISDGRLFTTRISQKTGRLPRWGQQLMKTPHAVIMEESVVDPIQKRMISTTRNISHKGIICVEETQTLVQHPENANWTQVTTEARIMSNVGWGLTSRIESFGLKRFGDGNQKSKRAMKWVLEKLQESQEHLCDGFRRQTPPSWE